MIIDGQKWSCEACVRGHRVTTCKHHGRPLIHINRKGRPFSTCSLCHRTPCPFPDEHGKLKRETEHHHHNLHTSKRASGSSNSRYSRPFTGFPPIAPRPVAAKTKPVSISPSPPYPPRDIPERPEGERTSTNMAMAISTAHSEPEPEPEFRPSSFDFFDSMDALLPPTTAPVPEKPRGSPFSLPALSESIPSTSTSTSSSLSSSSDIMSMPALGLPVDLEMEMELPLPMVEGPWDHHQQQQDHSALEPDLMGASDPEAGVDAFCALDDMSVFPVPGDGGAVLQKGHGFASIPFWVPGEEF